MVNKRLGLGIALVAAGATTVLAAPAAQAAPNGVIHVPSDFVTSLQDVRGSGQYDVTADGGLHIKTTTGTDKVAEYVATNRPLAQVDEPSLDYTPTSGAIPGFQLVVDFDGNGTPDGILVGEPVYNGDWWATNGSAQFVRDAAPLHGTGFGSTNHGTLDEWRTAFPDAVVQDFGFSLGTGPQGEGVINAINFAGTSYTFANDVILKNKEQCKGGGWATSTVPTYRNQGECVSHFAASGSNAAAQMSTVTVDAKSSAPVDLPTLSANISETITVSKGKAETTRWCAPGCQTTYTDGVESTNLGFVGGSPTTTAPGKQVGAVLYRIGKGPWVEIDRPVTITGAGPVQLAYNDNEFSDNSGSYTVTVERSGK